MNPLAEQQHSERLWFLSGGTPVGMVAYRSSSANPPSILVLHGAGGVDSRNRHVAHLAEALASHGCHTFILEYFDRTGTIYATEPIIRARFEEWLETIVDAVSFMIQQ